MDRRSFLKAGLALGAAALSGCTPTLTRGLTEKPTAAPGTANALSGSPVWYGCTELGNILPAKQAQYDKITVFSKPECRLLQIGEGGEAFVLVSLDVIGCGKSTCDKIRADIAEAANTSPASVWVSITHNHCWEGGMDDDYIRGVVLRTWKDARQVATRAPRVGFGWTRVGMEYNVNRRGDAPHGLGRFSVWQSRECRDVGVLVDGMDWCKTVLRGNGANDDELKALTGQVLLNRVRDDRLQVLLVGEPDRPAAGIVRFTGHPVAPRDESNKTAISRDYFGFLVDRLQELWGCPFLMVQGTAGDHRVRHSAQTTEECRRIGRGVAECIAPAKVQVEWATLDRIVTLNDKVECRVNPDIPSDPALIPALTAEVKAKLAALPHGLEYLPERKRLGDQRARLSRVGRTAGQKTIDVDLSGAKLGPFTVVAYPGELASVFGRRLQPRLGDATMICGYTNASVSYLLDADDYAYGDYEAWSGRVDSRDTDKIIDGAEALARRL